MKWHQRWESFARLYNEDGDIVGEIGITNGFWFAWANGQRINAQWPSAQRHLAMQSVEQAVLQPV